MPELPEVQTIVNDLKKKIKSETIADFWSDWKKGVKISLAKFKREIKKRKILSVERIGKNILLDLSGGKAVIIHLRMTGVLRIKSYSPKPNNLIKARLFPSPTIRPGIPQSQALDKHVHHIFYFRSGKILEFSDIRKFGSLELVDSDKLVVLSSLKKLGTDVMSSSFTFAKFDEILNAKKTNIKQLLMDQGKIAGLGNIYASEILHEAGISPLREAGSLGRGERKKLHQAIGKIIKKAIKLRGTSVSDYRDASGRRGGFQKILKVYGRTGKKCARCDTIIQRKIIGQRSSFYCPVCQK